MEVEICPECFAVIPRDRKTDHAKWHTIDTDRIVLRVMDGLKRTLGGETLVLYE